MYFDTRHWRCAVLKARGEQSRPVSGGYGEGETPLPIPNREVKPLSADGTWPSRAWESRSPPVLVSYEGRPRAAFRVSGAAGGLSATAGSGTAGGGRRRSRDDE